jgi:DNA replication initiation complex subunit (GINS family)
MTTTQNRAVKNYRARLGDKGLSRFEVLTLERDRELIGTLAKRLAQNDDEAARIRTEVGRAILGDTPKKGGVLAALRRSPMAKGEIELDIQRPFESGRKIDL